MASADKLPKAHEVVLEIFTVQRHVCALSWLHKSSALQLRAEVRDTSNQSPLPLKVSPSFNADSYNPPSVS